MRVLTFFLSLLLLTTHITSQLTDSILEIQNTGINNVFLQTQTDLSSTNGFSLDIYFSIHDLDLSLSSNYTVFNYETATGNTSFVMNFKENSCYFNIQDNSYSLDLKNVPINLNDTTIFIHIGGNYDNMRILVSSNYTHFTPGNINFISPSGLFQMDGPGTLIFNIDPIHSKIRYQKFIYYNYRISNINSFDFITHFPGYPSTYLDLPVILYDFDETTGNIIYNKVGNNNLYVVGSGYKWINSVVYINNGGEVFNIGRAEIQLQMSSSYRFYIPIVYFKINGNVVISYAIKNEYGILSSFVYLKDTSDITANTIYVSPDNVTYFDTHQSVKSIPILSLLPSSQMHYIQPDGSNPNTYNKYTSNINYIIYISLGISVGIMTLFILLIVIHPSEVILNFLSKSDYLRLQNKQKTPIVYAEPINNNFNTESIRKNTISKEERKIGLGISYKVHKQTTALGGVLTYICLIMALSLITVYLYNVLSNNVTTTSNSSIANGLIVDNLGKSLNVSVTYPYIESIVPCLSTTPMQTGECNQLLISGLTLGISTSSSPKSVCTETPSDIPNYKHCRIDYFINNITDFADTFEINFNTVLQINLYINLTVSISSYSTRENSIISSTILPTSNTLISSGSLIYYDLNQVAYNYLNDPIQTGYILDYRSKIINTAPLDNYTPEYISYNNPTAFSIKFTKNSNWIYINVDYKNTNIVILAELLAILTGTFNIGKYLYSILCSESVRRVIFKLKCLRRDRIDSSIEMDTLRNKV